MSWIRISWKNILHRPLASVLSILLLAFGAGIISLLMSVSKQVEGQFTKNISGIDMVVGAKGSPLQLILSSVYQIDAPTGNISLKEYQKLIKNPLVKKGIPLAYGDNYEGYRMVGSDTSYMGLYNAQLSEGKIWSKSGEALLGSRVHELTTLKIGSSFVGSHGLDNKMEDKHDHFEYKVVGILKPTGTVLDKLILTNIESVWDVHDHGDDHGHEHSHDHGHEHEHEEEKPKEITAALIQFKSPMGNLTVPRMVNQRTQMQAALPAIEINRLFTLMGTGMKTLRSLAILIVLISGISVFISLYQSLKDRKFELALLRSMGASRMQLFGLVIIEGLLISIIGYIIGIILGKLGLWLISTMTDQAYSYELNVSFITMDEVILFGGILAVGFLASLLPSIQAFRLNISKTLANA